MLREAKAKQLPGEPRRRWFRDDAFDLFVWYREDGGFDGFQLCYDKLDDQHAFTWLAGRGVTHYRVDEPEEACAYGQTPIMVSGHEFPAARVREAFRVASAALEPAVRALVLEILGRQ